MIRLEPRPEPSRAWSLAVPPLAVLLTILAGGAMFAALGANPGTAIRSIFWDPLFDPGMASYSRPQLLVKAAPLILIATGLALGFRAGVWNIGAEGQYIVGAIAGAATGLALYPADLWIVFPLMVLAGALGGIAWGLIPGLLRLLGASEILTSLLLVYVAQQILAAAALGFLRNPEGGGFPGSRNLARDYPAASNPELLAGTGVHWGVVAAAVAVVAAHWLLTRHVAGFHLRLAGQSPRAAALAGVRPPALILGAFAVSGGLAGLAGLFEVAGPAGQISIDFASGYGFTAIIVAFLGRLHPLGIAAAGLLMALTVVGGEVAQLTLGLPSASIQAFQGMLLFFLLGCDVLVRHRIRLRRAAAPAPRPAAPAEKARWT